MARGIRPEDRSAWEGRGGRIRFDQKGRPVYIIRKQIAGRRYEVSTRRHTLAAALSEWERFEKDPEGYAPGAGAGQEPIYLDNDLAAGFLTWSRIEKGNTVTWVNKQKAALAWWMERLRGVNLRRATLRDHILPPLEKAPGRRAKMSDIKAFYGWLRKVRHVITSAEDPTIDMPLPQAQPEQWKRSKVVPRDHIELVLEHLGSPWREALTIQAGTGWHTTEVVRFAGSGTIEPLPKSVQQEGVAAVLCCPQHKSGEPIRTRASRRVVEAAKRLLEHARRVSKDREVLREARGDKEVGAFSREWYDRAVRAACAVVKRPDGQIGIPVFTPGRLRHSVATWAIEAGADPASVAAFLGHKSPRTTKRFYATHASPVKVPTLA